MFRKNYDVQKYFVQVMGICMKMGNLEELKGPGVTCTLN